MTTDTPTAERAQIHTWIDAEMKRWLMTRAASTGVRGSVVLEEAITLLRNSLEVPAKAEEAKADDHAPDWVKEQSG